jgi:hypothetical protein
VEKNFPPIYFAKMSNRKIQKLTHMIKKSIDMIRTNLIHGRFDVYSLVVKSKIEASYIF